MVSTVNRSLATIFPDSSDITVFKCKQDVHAVSTATRFIYSLLGLAAEATESIVATYCHIYEDIRI